MGDLEALCGSPREVALLRIQLLQDGGNGLPERFVAALKDSLDAFFLVVTSSSSSHQRPADPSEQDQRSLAEAKETIDLRRCLQLHLKLNKIDATLSEELARQGSQSHLLQLIEYDIDRHSDVTDQDVLIELQDLACEISAYSKDVSRSALAFSREDLIERLPLVFETGPAVQYSPDADPKKSAGEIILIHQVNERQSAQADVGFGE